MYRMIVFCKSIYRDKILMLLSTNQQHDILKFGFTINDKNVSNAMFVSLCIILKPFLYMYEYIQLSYIFHRPNYVVATEQPLFIYVICVNIGH